MNSPLLNKFDPANAAALCRASAAAYLDCASEEGVMSRLTDTHVRITDDGSDLIVAFRGTADVRNWLTDLDCGWGLENGFHVHRGFARALDSVEAEVRAEIVARGGKGRRIWLTGHSLGGALAMLFAWRLWNGFSTEAAVHNLPPSSPQTRGGEGRGEEVFMDSGGAFVQGSSLLGAPLSGSLPALRGEREETKRQEVGTPRRGVRGWFLRERSPRRGDPTGEGEEVMPWLAGVYTFGQPRVGDSTFRDCYNFSGLLGRTFRVVHADDIVPRMPWLLGAYRHAGHEVFHIGDRIQNSEFRGSDFWLLDPGFFAKLPWDLRNAWRELCQGKVALLADHHVSTYLNLFQAGSIQSQPAQRLCL